METRGFPPPPRGGFGFISKLPIPIIMPGCCHVFFKSGKRFKRDFGLTRGEGESRVIPSLFGALPGAGDRQGGAREFRPGDARDVGLADASAPACRIGPDRFDG
jgi:hypothetical protein